MGKILGGTMFDFLKKIFVKPKEKKLPELWDNKLQKTVPPESKNKNDL